jgi:DNA-binding SARP family transcriptional activator/tetratricopeptide (TPR) repeat protein
MASLNVDLLGPPVVRHGDRPVALPTRKALALLIYLVAEGRPQSRDYLVALFWPDSDADAGRSSLRSTLTRLRQGVVEAGGDDHLLAQRDVVAVRAPDGGAVDLDRDLDRLAAAHDLARRLAGGAGAAAAGERRAAVACLQDGADAWRGEFAEGLALADAPEFEVWVGLQREVWRGRMEAVLDRLSAMQADGGDALGAADTLARWLRIDPLEEHAYRRLMEVQLTRGNRAAALAAFDRCRQVLADELGVDPEPATAALAERIRLAPPSPDPSQGRGRERPAPAPPDPPFVGRGEEFAALVEHFHAAARGRPQAVIVGGEAGIGKTRLATEFAGWAAGRGAEVLHGRAYEAAAAAPYQPLVDALRPRLAREPDPAALLGPVWLGELGRLLPELRERRPDLPAPTGDEAAARVRLFETVARLGQALAARGPLVLVLDDVQRADSASLDALHYAVRRWDQEQAPVLLLCCRRDEAVVANRDLDDWIDGLGRALAVSRIALGPLDAAATSDLVRGLAPGRAADPGFDALAGQVFADTLGQPFYVVETVRSLLALADPPGVPAGAVGTSAPLPPGVQRLIRARLAPLSSVARDLLVAAAVLGRGVEFDLLRRVSRLPEDEALAALDAALRGHLLAVGGGTDRYRFSHDRIRDVVVAEAGEARRRVFHRRALDALADAGAPAAELVSHAEAAGEDEAALRFGIAAGDEAMRLLAPREAGLHYERAAALADRLGRADLLPDLHARRGRAFVAAGVWAEARRVLLLALVEFAPAANDRRVEILADLTAACWWDLDIPAVARHAAEALATARTANRSDLETEAVAWQGAAEGALGNLAACGALLVDAKQRSRDLGIPVPTIAGHYLPLTLYWQGRPTEAVAEAEEAVAIARERQDIPWLMTALPNLGLALTAVGRYGEAMPAFAEARRLGRQSGADTLLARAIAISTGFHNDLFDHAGAEALAAEARDLARSVGFPPPAVSAGIDLLVVRARRGEVGDADALVDEVAAAIDAARAFHRWLWRIRLTAVQAEIALLRGDLEPALGWAEETIAQSRARGRPKYAVLGLTARAEQRRRSDRTADAIVDLRDAVALARGIGDPALFLRPAAALLALDGDDDLAAEARLVAARIAHAVPDAEMRRRFEEAEAVRFILGLP